MDGQRTESFSVYRSDDGRTVSLSGKNVSYGYSWISAIYGDDPGGEKRSSEAFPAPAVLLGTE